MKKVALVFVLAVFVPSLLLAWLAVRSLRDQQFILERQQAFLYQGVVDGIARDVQDQLSSWQREFRGIVDQMLTTGEIKEPVTFDDSLRQRWPLAEVGFVVSVEGAVLAPPLSGTSAARRFRLENERFLANRETAEVYSNVQNRPDENAASDSTLRQRYGLPGSSAPQNKGRGEMNVKAGRRSVVPLADQLEAQAFSKANVAETEFRQLIGDTTEGTLARFLENRLKLLFWYRSPRTAQWIFGAQLSLPKITERLRTVLESRPLDPAMQRQVCLALIDDAGRPAARSPISWKADWKHPFVASEIGDVLPHWEAALYLLNPHRFNESARTIALTIGLLVGLLVIAIAVGGWLIVADLKRQLAMAQQKTDFVSNVSHELKTPLTSIRMFSELLADGKVSDSGKQRSYLNIISAEAARLTRLINNVLDFARLDRGEQNYHFQPLDLNALAATTFDSYRPQLETTGFRLDCQMAPTPLPVRVDRDAVAQIIVNLLSNAEKYSGNEKEISVRTELRKRKALVHIQDRGTGVPPGAEEKIFHQFYRAHDSLSSGIPGSGLGLTLAREMARAHGGEIAFSRPGGGGSRFTLELPLAPVEPATPRNQSPDEKENPDR